MAEMLNYVKFIRGTQAAFDRIRVKDPDTLYFVREKDARVGSLYIGDTKISGVDRIVEANVGELADVNVDRSTLVDGSILAYDWAAQEWKNTTLQAVSAPVLKGATEDENGVEGLVPAPLKGQQNYFLRGDAQWVDVAEMINSTTGDLVARVGRMDKQVAEVVADVRVIKHAVADLDASRYVLKEVYAAEVGDINELNTSENNTAKTLIGEINSINQRLTWNNY